MKKKIKYTDEPSDVNMDNAKRINDFLPPPKEIVFNEDTMKVTLLLNRQSVEFFKKEADKRGLKYQNVIRNIIDNYVSVQTSSVTI